MTNKFRIYQDFPTIQFWEYTKRPDLAFKLKFEVANCHVTFSRSDTTKNSMVHRMISHGINVAVVFDTKKGQPLPKTFLGYEVIDGDLHDNRWTDPVGVIVGLRAKADAKKDDSGFVIKVAELALAA